MKKENTDLNDCYILTPNFYGDNRGGFFVPFNSLEMEQFGFQELKQVNQSVSHKGVLRGMHFQGMPDTQAKIVRVTKGAVLDVVIDIRKDSSTYGKYTSVLLTADNRQMLYVPRGFAHGFLCLENDTQFEYFVDNIYSPKKDGGILWNDPTINIPWENICKDNGIHFSDLKLKEADEKRPTLSECPTKFYKKYRYLITGATGQLGYDIKRELASKGIFDVIDIGIEDLDITNYDRVRDVIKAYKPEVIFHCAAYTNVKKAEEEPEKAELVNVCGTKNLALAAEEVGSKFIYVSTDYVFDGKKDGIYDTEDKTNPLNVYGKTKLLGEEVVKRYSTKGFIVRTSWVFGINGNNFVKTMLNQAMEKNCVNVVSDQVGSPTYTVDLAKFLINLGETDFYGLYQAHNEGFCSWYDFTKKIFECAELNCVVNPINSTDFPSKVERPTNSRMSTSSLINQGFELLPTWEDATSRFVKELKHKNL